MIATASSNPVRNADGTRRAVIATAFFPRGGSAHVARGLAGTLPRHGWETTVLSGSVPGAGDAERFYAGLDVHAVDLAANGLLASYEDRAGAPDGVFAGLDDDAAERLTAAWADALEAAGAACADVLHLNHLTPLHAAAERVAPEVPVVSHLHGTELLMLERIDEGAPGSWRHAEAWAERLRTWAQSAAITVVPAERQLERARRLLDLPAERVVAIPNGTDLGRFARAPEPVDRAAFWRRHLVERPRGWRPGGEEGSVAYADADLAAIDGGGPILLYAGRFTEVKRLGLLIRAFADAQRRTAARPALVIVGGHPGEWEGEHPLEAIEAAGAQDVFLAGWHDHDELPSLAGRRRRDRAAVGARAVRPGAGRGDGLRAARGRRRRARPGRDRARRKDRLAGRTGRSGGTREGPRGGRRRWSGTPSPRGIRACRRGPPLRSRRRCCANCGNICGSVRWGQGPERGSGDRVRLTLHITSFRVVARCGGPVRWYPVASSQCSRRLPGHQIHALDQAAKGRRPLPP